ncbi:hypothetical protein [Kitasatospora sp. A2-31]|uniref:hypothetical protein n=1 Tax=Kitasatospora sp. A2-31 TaxID=2916414 RepID=UPI001EE78CD3|nr:hypothetical protein [Kitasatospora sp. A2-31]MCG6493705.1 hypothetical protein [Kitasatospora sp. A2-31]
MTVTTALPHADAVALADQRLGAWLKQEGCEEPPPPAPAPVRPAPVHSDRARSGPPDPTGPTDPAAPAGHLADTGRRNARPAPADLLGRVPVVADAPAERLRLGGRALLDRDSGPLRGRAGRYDRRRLRTPAPHGTHQLTLTIATGADGPTWVRLEAETHTTGSGVRTPCRVPVPELARALLPLLDAADGPAAVQLAPRVLTADEVDGLIDELCDPERRLPTVVASVPADRGIDEWVAEVVRPLCGQLPGLATAYVLDPGARTEFNVALEYHSVYGGAVRTYLPEVDPASRHDGARHPVLARRRIEEDLRRAAGLLAREPRRIAAEQPLPPPLAAVPVLRVAPVVPRAGSGPDAAASAAELAVLAHEEQQDRAEEQARADELQRVRHSLRRERRGGAQVRALAGRFCGGSGGVAAAAGRTGRLPGGPGIPGGPGVPGIPGIPGTFTELMARIDEFPLLTFTGDQKSALALDEIQCPGAGWARLTWDGLTALQEYAEAAVRGEAGGDFKQWCEHTPAGCHRFPPRKAVRGESRTVFSHTKWKRERMLPVPECVDASRRAFMGAHLRIGGGRTAPRLHYLDDCSGSGRIYVGYIGLHLTNTRTN